MALRFRPSTRSTSEHRSRDQLHAWLLGLPWVIERPGMESAAGVRWFAVDCPPLAIRRVWALTGSLFGGEDEWAIHLVLPRPTAEVVVALTAARLAEWIGPEHRLVSLPIGQVYRPRHIERLVGVAYDAALA